MENKNQNAYSPKQSTNGKKIIIVISVALLIIFAGIIIFTGNHEEKAPEQSQSEEMVPIGTSTEGEVAQGTLAGQEAGSGAATGEMGGTGNQEAEGATENMGATENVKVAVGGKGTETAATTAKPKAVSKKETKTATAPKSKSSSKKEVKEVKVATAKNGSYYLQVGAFADKKNFDGMKAEMDKMGYPTSVKMTKNKTTSADLYLLLLGPYDSEKKALAEKKELKGKKIDSYLVKN